MFFGGEYAIYCDNKVVVLVCDNQLFIKPTDGGRSYIGDVVEAPSYPGAKLSFLVEDKFENRDWISNLIWITVKELPEPRPKKKNYYVHQKKTKFQIIVFFIRGFYSTWSFFLSNYF